MWQARKSDVPLGNAPAMLAQGNKSKSGTPVKCAAEHPSDGDH
jgi:hypothetical protein